MIVSSAVNNSKVQSFCSKRAGVGKQVLHPAQEGQTPFGGAQPFRPPLAQALHLLNAAHEALEQLIALAQGGQALAGQRQEVRIRRQGSDPRLLEFDLARGHLHLLLLVILPEIQPAGEGFQAALGFAQGFHAAAVVGGEPHFPHGALDVLALQHEAQHPDRRLRRLQLRLARRQRFRGPGRGSRTRFRPGLSPAQFLARGLHGLEGGGQARLGFGEFAFELLAVAFDPGRDLVQIGLRELGAGVRDDELPLEPAEPDAAFGQGLLAELAFGVQDAHAGGRHLAAETLQVALPGEAGRGRGILRPFELLVELANPLLGLVQRSGSPR